MLTSSLLLSAAERRGTPVGEGFLYQESAVGRVVVFVPHPFMAEHFYR